MDMKERLRSLGINEEGVPVVLKCLDDASMVYLPTSGITVFEGLSHDSCSVDEKYLPQPRFCFRGKEGTIYSVLFSDSEILEREDDRLVVDPSFDGFIMDHRKYSRMSQEYAKCDDMLRGAEVA